MKSMDAGTNEKLYQSLTQWSYCKEKNQQHPGGCHEGRQNCCLRVKAMGKDPKNIPVRKQKDL